MAWWLRIFMPSHTNAIPEPFTIPQPLRRYPYGNFTTTGTDYAAQRQSKVLRRHLLYFGKQRILRVFIYKFLLTTGMRFGSDA